MGTLSELFLPPPVKGLDWRVNMGAQPTETAAVLDSIVCCPQHLERANSASIIANLGGLVPCTAHEYQGSAIYAAQGLIGVGGTLSPNTAVTDTVMYSTTFGTGAGSFFIACNAADTPKVYDGTAWSNLAVTGPTLANILQALPYRKRLYLADKTKLGFWYLAPDAIAGAATFYSASSLCRRGGVPVAMAVISLDGGSGSDDLLMLYTSNGEALVFAGNDPAASTWSPVGTFFVGAPMSGTVPNPNIVTNRGGDVLVFTVRGLMPMSKILKGFPPNDAVSLDAAIHVGLNGTLTSPRQFFVKYVTGVGIFLALGNTTDGELFFFPDRGDGWSRLYSPAQIAGTNVSTYKGIWNVTELGTAVSGFANGVARNLLGGNVQERWVIRHTPFRLKGIRDFRICEYRPIITANQTIFYAINSGFAFNFSDVFTYNLLLKPQNQWPIAGPLPPTVPATSNVAMAHCGWMTPQSDSGFCASLQLTGDPTTVWGNVQYHGTDVRAENLNING